MAPSLIFLIFCLVFLAVALGICIGVAMFIVEPLKPLPPVDPRFGRQDF